MLITVTPATVEPVSVTEAKEYLRVTHNSDDALIGRLIAGAREYIERLTQRAWAEAGYKATFDEFASPLVLGPYPVAAVSAVTYLDGDGVRQTAGALTYTLDADRSEVVPVDAWPYGTSVVVEFTAEPAVAVPETIKTGIFLRVQADYEGSPEDADRLREASVNMAHMWRLGLGV